MRSVPGLGDVGLRLSGISSRGGDCEKDVLGRLSVWPIWRFVQMIPGFAAESRSKENP